MGSTMKRSIFDEQTSKALKNWRNKAKGWSTETRTLGGGSIGLAAEAPLEDVNIDTKTELQEHGNSTIVTGVDGVDNRDLLTGP